MALGEQFSDVLNAARSGAPWALEVLYRAFHPPVLAFLRARAPAEAEDLASDVFVAVAEGLGRFEGNEDGFLPGGPPGQADDCPVLQGAYRDRSFAHDARHVVHRQIGDHAQ